MSKTNILIVENEMIIALDIKSVLLKSNFNITGIIASGTECKNHLLTNKPNLILMDIRLDGELDGIDTADFIRNNYHIPVIFITAHSDESSLQRIVRTEHYGYIVKPVNEKELITSIQTSLYRHEIDKKIIESEKKFRKLFDQSRDANYISDIDDNFIDVNQSMSQLFGYTKKKLLNLNLKDLFTQKKNLQNITNTMNKDGFVNDYELKLRKKNKSEIYCLITSALLYDDNGNVTGTQAIIKDISVRKKIEKENELILLDLEKRVKELNCFYSLSEISEKHDNNIDLILKEMVTILPFSWQYPELACSRILYNEKEYKSAKFKTSKWKQSEDIIVNKIKSGKVEVYYSKNKHGNKMGPFIKEEKDLIKAITDRLGKIAESNISEDNLIKSRNELRNLTARLQTIREDERTKISREIHDELGQALTAIKMDVSWIEKKLDGNKIDLKNRTKSMLKIIDNTIQTVRRISSDLRPGILDDLGLCAAIEWQAGEIESRKPIKINIKYNTEDPIENIKHKVSIFRIFQEAMTNVIRHSKASKVTISLNKFDDKIELEIQDNGIGISDEQINYSNSCGLIGMRERVNYCKGTISIKGQKNKGTKIKITIPT